MKLLHILILLFTASCCGPKNIQSSDKMLYHDSVYVEVVKVDTIKIPQESSSIVYQPITLHDTIIVSKNTRTKATLRIKDKKITCEAYCDSIQKAYLSSIIATKNNCIISSSTQLQKKAIKSKDKFWEGFLAGIVSTSAFLIGYKIAKNKI